MSECYDLYLFKVTTKKDKAIVIQVGSLDECSAYGYAWEDFNPDENDFLLILTGKPNWLEPYPYSKLSDSADIDYKLIEEWLNDNAN